MRHVPMTRRVLKRWGWVAGLVALTACSGSSDSNSRAGGVRGYAGNGSGANGTNANGMGAFGNAIGTVNVAAAAGSGSGDPACRNATVAFVIDGSGSMCAQFGNSTRWGELRKALLDKTNGLIYLVQGYASFGMYLYDGTIDFMLAAQATQGASASQNPMCGAAAAFRRTSGPCPQIVEVAPARNNASAIDAKFPQMELGGSTPTDKALNYVVDQLAMQRGTAQASADNPQYIILATDGAPNDICVGGMGGDGTAQQMGTVAAVDRAASMGITTFVISLADDPTLQMHLDEVARHGDPSDPQAHTFSPMGTNDLVTTLKTLLGNAIGCPI